MLITSTVDEKKEVCVETIDLTNACYNTDDEMVSPGLPAMCSVTDVNVKPRTFSELISEQSVNSFCWQSATAGEMPGTSYSYDRNGIFLRKAPIHAAIQTLVHISLHARILHLSHNLILAA